MTKSGNPYHDKEGKFTSPEGVGSGGGVEKKTENVISYNSDEIKPKLKIKTSIDVQELKKTLDDFNQTSNVPRLYSARDIEDNCAQLFSKNVTNHINELYGKSSDVSSYQFHPKANPHMTLEIFPNVLGKYRYKDNHAAIVDIEKFNELLYSGQYEKIYRGISSRGQKAIDIVSSYGKIDLNNFDYYCPNAGNCYGSNVYNTVDRNYAMSYAGYGNGTLINGLLDNRNSWHMRYDDVIRIKNSIDSNKVFTNVQAQLEKNGLDTARAQRIAKSFSNAIKNDAGLVAICMGLDYYISANHQRNLFNLKKWIIRDIKYGN